MPNAAGDRLLPVAAGDLPTPLARRARDVQRLADETWDVLIVGGGIVGAGALLDAAARGLRAALVEQDDIAVGTSSRSSRLIHGGLRYLQHLQVGIVRESLAERARLLRLAPHLVRLVSFLFPLYGRPVVTRAFYGAGLAVYDALGSSSSGGRHRHLSRADALEYAPDLRTGGLRGGLLYHDAMEDDARLALAVVRTALAHAPETTVAVTRAWATGPIRDGERVIGARIEDRVTGTSLDVRATAVLDATGAWAAMPDRPFGGSSFSVLPSSGSHLIVPRGRIAARDGLTLRVRGRNAFLVPWPRHWVIGTTDRPYTGPVDRPAAGSADVDEILGTVNGALDIGLTRDDVVGTYAGLRPLIAASTIGSTARISREHRVSIEVPGLVRVSGGKLTTYRVMARDAVDAVLGRDARSRPSVTAELPIIGAAARSELDALTARLVAASGLTEDAARSLVERHGVEAAQVVDLGRRLGLLADLVPGLPFLEAEVAWAVEQELALGLDDMLARRTRLAPELPDRGAGIAPRVASIMAAGLGWDSRRQAAEVATYLAGAHREFDVPEPS